jgi:hypothetical protein
MVVCDWDIVQRKFEDCTLLFLGQGLLAVDLNAISDQCLSGELV